MHGMKMYNLKDRIGKGMHGIKKCIISMLFVKLSRRK